MLGGRGGALIAFFVVAAHNGDFFPVHHPCFSWILYICSAIVLSDTVNDANHRNQ